MLKTDNPRPPAASVDQQIGAIRSLLESGRTAEAEPRLQALIKLHGGNAWFWAALARCHQELADTSAELAALECLLILEPSRNAARVRAARLLVERGDIAGAAAHYQVLSDAQPELSRIALQLARLRQSLGDHAGEAAALKRFLEAEPDHGGIHGRMADLLEAAGQLAEATPHLKRYVQARPEKVRAWVRLAEAAEAAGDWVEAAAAWERADALLPNRIAASERRLAALSLAEASARGPASARALKVQVIGNCQAYPMGRWLRALLPDAEITALNWGELRSEAHVAQFAKRLETFDALVAQPVKTQLQPLGQEALAAGPARLVAFPGLHFTGFQPDAVRLIAKGLKSLIGEWHSALIMAAWRMGLPPARAQELFNAYVYGVLGYFDEYAKAETFLRRSAKRIGWDLTAEFEAWPRPFVHTPTHPRIEVMRDLALGVCERLGLEAAADARAPPDHFVTRGAWPIYPEIARRLGLAGEMTFVSPFEQGRVLDLDEAIAWYYAAYAKVPAELLAVERVDQVIALLKAEGI